MPKTGMHVVRPIPSAVAQHRKIREKLRAHLKILGVQTAKEYGNLAKDWRNKPQWTSKVTIFRKGLIVIRFIIVNKNQKVSNSNLTVEELFNIWERTGSVPHIIRGKTGNVLRWKKNNDVFYAYFVNHPGTKPKNLTIPINEEAKEKIPPLLIKSVQEGLQ